MKLSDVTLAKKAIKHLPQDIEKDDEPASHVVPNPQEITDEQLSGAERFIYLQDKVITMMPEDQLPKTAEEFLMLNNLIYNNIANIQTDIPREVITQWEHISPTRRKREVENPYRYT